jgi:hypothetical protein
MPFASFAQNAREAALSPQAQAAVEEGVSAAKQAQWEVAISSFNEARLAAPESPIPLSNLGLAEAQLPGHELRAICWFEAYLALAPNAANAPAVHQQITILKNRVQGNADKIIAMLKVLAAQIPSDAGNARSHAKGHIAAMLISERDMDAAEQIVQQSGKYDQDSVHYETGQFLLQLNLISDAIKEADLSVSSKSVVYNSICERQIAAGDYEGAKRSIEQLESPDQLYERLALVEAEYHSGQRGDAGNILSVARASVDKESDMNLRERYLAYVAVTEYKIDLREQSDALLRQIKNDVDNISGKDKDGHRAFILDDLTGAYSDTGRRSEALDLLKQEEKACAIKIKEHEEGGGFWQCEYSLFQTNLYKLNDYDGAERIIKHFLYGKDYTEEDRQRWREEINDAKTQVVTGKAEAAAKAVQAASLKTLADAGSSPLQRAQAWENYLQAFLNAPIYTSDFKATLTALPNFAPPANDPSKSQTVFDHVTQPASDLLTKLNDIHALARSQSYSKDLVDDFEAHK